jgi:hypothetical protein
MLLSRVRNIPLTGCSSRVMGTINEMTVVREQEASYQDEHHVPSVRGREHVGRNPLLTLHSPKTLQLSRSPKYPRKSVPHVPRMDAANVLIHPLNTESAMKKVRAVMSSRGMQMLMLCRLRRTTRSSLSSTSRPISARSPQLSRSSMTSTASRSTP